MMWSQCTWDMKTWKVCGDAGPWRASTLLAERARAAAEVAEHVLGAAGLDLDAGRVAAERAGDSRSRPSTYAVEVLVGRERAAGGAAQRGDQLRADVRPP